MELNELRSEIDKIDAALLSLFERRMDIVAQIAALKREGGVPILDSKREAEVINALSERVQLELRPYVHTLYNAIFEISRTRQQEIYEAG